MPDSDTTTMSQRRSPVQTVLVVLQVLTMAMVPLGFLVGAARADGRAEREMTAVAAQLQDHEMRIRELTCLRDDITYLRVTQNNLVKSVDALTNELRHWRDRTEKD